MTQLSGCLLRLFFITAFLSLATRFILGIFAPGTQETVALFDLLAPALPHIENLTNLLMFPVDWLYQHLQPLVGREFLASTPADEFFDAIAHLILAIPGLADSDVGKTLMTQDYTTRFPGEMEWLAAVTIVFWYGVELVLALIDLNIARLRYQLTRDQAARKQKELSRNFPANPPPGPFSK
jgi:hypothetical protein